MDAKLFVFSSTAMFACGLVLLIASTIYVSSFLALLSIALFFWGIILLYLKPSKYVTLDLLNASISDIESNVERVFFEFEMVQKGIYLPPKNLQGIDSSLVFIPKDAKTALPAPEESSGGLTAKSKNGIFITPPGLGLLKFFEREIGISFSKTDFEHLQTNLPKMFTGDLEIAEAMEIKLKKNIIEVKMKGCVLSVASHHTENLSRVHAQVGCLMSSALACALAKTIGKPLTIQNEKFAPESKSLVIDYRIWEE